MQNIIENFRFLVIEAETQVKLTYGLLMDFNLDLLEKISSKDDYIDNLKTTVENDCFSTIHAIPGYINQKKRQDIRAIHIICVNLERIADYCVNIARQTHYLSHTSFIQKYDYKSMFQEIQSGLIRISTVFDSRDLAEALEICRTEFHIDQLYKENFDLMLDELKRGMNVTDVVTTIFIFRYLERIGDSLLNIGEALLFAIMGERIKIRQFEALEKTLSEAQFEGSISDIDFNSIWGSRSGCRISKVSRKKPSGFKAQGIFKEGNLKKIKQEQENIKRWNEIFPNLAPKMFGYQEKGETASMLVEFLAGCTIDQVILTDDTDTIRNVIFIFEHVLNEVWTKSLKPGPVATDYMEQFKSRMSSVYRVHPYFRRPHQQIENLDIHSTEDLIQQCVQVEKELPAPFTVFIHGDFNTNNIVYNHEEQRINFIDLYRSRDWDYIQDASVFLISNFRLPVFDSELRERLNTVSLYFYEWFSDFARNNHDHTFEIRMALALARSLFTSTRFELNFGFAREMYLRSHYLLEKIAAHAGRPWDEFRLPDHIFFY
jgi:phosphate uptake regulator